MELAGFSQLNRAHVLMMDIEQTYRLQKNGDRP